MTRDSNSSPTIADENPGKVPALAGLLAHLKANFHASQHALLARDLGRLESLAAEQAGLRLAMAHVLNQRWLQPDLLPADLSREARDVLQLGRVQSALLDRAQQSLRTIANLLAGTQAAYTSGGRVGRDLPADKSGAL